MNRIIQEKCNSARSTNNNCNNEIPEVEEDFFLNRY